MEFADAVRARHSYRGFTSRQVDEETLKQVFELASWAPSNCNVQPWHVHVLSGEACNRMREKMVAVASTDTTGNPDFPWQGKFTGDYKERQICSALGLWEHQGVTRDNPEKRAWSWMRNFEFFDAPHIAFIGMNPEFGATVALDVGMYAQTFMLTLVAHGLASCPMGTMRNYPDLVRDAFDIKDGTKILFGICFGYEDPAVPANKTRTSREVISSSVTFRQS